MYKNKAKCGCGNEFQLGVENPPAGASSGMATTEWVFCPDCGQCMGKRTYFGGVVVIPAQSAGVICGTGVVEKH